MKFKKNKMKATTKHKLNMDIKQLKKLQHLNLISNTQITHLIDRQTQ